MCAPTYPPSLHWLSTASNLPAHSVCAHRHAAPWRGMTGAWPPGTSDTH